MSNTSDPQTIGRFSTGGWYAFDVAVSGDIMYVTDELHGLVCVDVSDPANPVQVGHADFGHSGAGGSIEVVGDTAYVSAHGWGLQVVDVTDPASPAYIGRISFDGLPDAVAHEAAIAGDKAFIAAGEYGSSPR